MNISTADAQASASSAVPRMLSPRQVCDLLGISRATYYRVRECGDFPAPVAVSKRRVAHPEADILAFLNRAVLQ
ncbi:AlpA family phage regulatory protein [Aromatoleum buckelii]|nr:AlpA family phage regulatory protein [Aromatoleum buckelii]